MDLAFGTGTDKLQQWKSVLLPKVGPLNPKSCVVAQMVDLFGVVKIQDSYAEQSYYWHLGQLCWF